MGRAHAARQLAGRIPAHLAPLPVGTVRVRRLVGTGRGRPDPPPVEIVPARAGRPLVGIAHRGPRVGIVPARPVPLVVGIVLAPSAPPRPAPRRRAAEREPAAPAVRRVVRSPQVAADRARVRPTTGRWVAPGRAGVRPAARRHPAHGGAARAGSRAGHALPGTISGREGSGRPRRRGRPGELATPIGSRREQGRPMAGRGEGPRGRQVEEPRGRQVEGAGGRRAERAGERRGASPGRPAAGAWNGRAARVGRARVGTWRGRFDSTRR
jgi:hypothetical protein